MKKFSEKFTNNKEFNMEIITVDGVKYRCIWTSQNWEIYKDEGDCYMFFGYCQGKTIQSCYAFIRA
jgi:hypothetical protein